MVGTYTDPNVLIVYSDGEVRQEFTLVYAATIKSGKLAIDEESKEGTLGVDARCAGASSGGFTASPFGGCRTFSKMRHDIPQMNAERGGLVATYQPSLPGYFLG